MKAPIFSAYAPNMHEAQRTIDKMAMCRRCFGSGISSRNAAADCQACSGTGKRRDKAPTETTSTDEPIKTRREMTAAEHRHKNKSEQAKKGWRRRRERAAKAALAGTASADEQPAPEPICSYTGLPMKHCLCGLDGCSSLKANA